MSNIVTNRDALRLQIRQIAERAGRQPNEIRLIAVSKTQPLSAIAALQAQEQVDFGENYAQELVQKSQALTGQNISWHFIGHLQRNKVNALLPHMQCLHTLDRLDLAKFLNEKLTAIQKNLSVLIEVKLSADANKTGLPSQALLPFIKELNLFENLKVDGLMMIATANATESVIRQEMRQLRELRDEINAQMIYNTPLIHLSMGMSQDYEIAIEEGSTMLRIGTLIFGDRPS